MRGDPPDNLNLFHLIFPSTPHARGSTAGSDYLDKLETVYPACAGIHLYRRHSFVFPLCLPRMRGDPPPLKPSNLAATKSTPHARGSTRIALPLFDHVFVYPACAGIHRLLKKTPV